jgi:hypothetical protein
MSGAERRFISLLAGIGATAIATLSKLTAPLGLPGGIAMFLVQRATDSVVAYGLAFFAVNFAFWTGGTYAVLAWRGRRDPAA